MVTAPVWGEAYSAVRSATEVAQGVAELRSGGVKEMRGGMVGGVASGISSVWTEWCMFEAFWTRLCMLYSPSGEYRGLL